MTQVQEFNVETGELIERELTVAEQELIDTNEAKKVADLAELAEKEAAKKSLLEKLGITEEEAKLLLS